MSRKGMRHGFNRRPRASVEPPEIMEKSRSQIKREMLALQKLGDEMACLSSRLLPELGLPEEILEAIAGLRALPPGGARKRQVKFLGGLLRCIAPDKLTEVERQFRMIKKVGITKTSKEKTCDSLH